MKKKITNNIKPTIDYTRYFIVLIVLIGLLLANEISNVIYFDRIIDRFDSLEKCIQEACCLPLPEWDDKENSH